MSIYRRMRSLSSNIVLVVLWRTQEHARHGELPNRIRDCSIPTPPDGTPKAHLNPFANADDASTFHLGTTPHTTTKAWSLLDDFCSRCHLSTMYVDQVPLDNVHRDPPSGLEHGLVRSTFHPTLDNGTGAAFATVEALLRNTANSQIRHSLRSLPHGCRESSHTLSSRRQHAPEGGRKPGKECYTNTPAHAVGMQGGMAGTLRACRHLCRLGT